MIWLDEKKEPIVILQNAAGLESVRNWYRDERR